MVRVAIDGPTAFVHETVVIAANQRGVYLVGLATVGPMDDVVTVAPRRWCVAPRKSAVLISQDEGFAGATAEGSLLTSVVDSLRFAVGDEAADASVATQSPCLVGRKDGAALQLSSEDRRRKRREFRELLSITNVSCRLRRVNSAAIPDQTTQSRILSTWSRHPAAEVFRVEVERRSALGACVHRYHRRHERRQGHGDARRHVEGPVLLGL